MVTGLVGAMCGLGLAPPAAGAQLPTSRAAASPTVPEGWSLTREGLRDVLVWQGTSATFGDAQIEFFDGDRLLGRPKPVADGHRYQLEVSTGAISDPAQLQVRAAGRRLDAAGLKSRRESPSTTATTPAALPVAAVDPGRPGKYATVTGEYTLKNVKLPDYARTVEMRAVVVAPKGARGRRPLALFLHGRHTICYGGDSQDWPCPAGSKPVPSYRGYLRAQRLLASQGYDTVSISANGINGQDWSSDDGGAQARSSLIRLHLAHWASWSGSGRRKAPAIVRKAPRADLKRVLLMGHSRGGEGVNRAAIDSLTPPPAAVDGYHGRVRWHIRGTLQIAPTLFGHDPAADVPSVVILPGCDGDVYNLQGQLTVDKTRRVGSGTALHSAVFAIGANHNYFNSEWTPGLAVAPAGDDWWDPSDRVCGTAKTGSARLTPTQQQKVGATYIAAAARLFVTDDDRVLPLLDGSGVQARSTRPARVLSHAVGAARTELAFPASNLKVTGSGATKARLCREVTDWYDAATCTPGNPYLFVPHFVAFRGVLREPDRYAVHLTWSSAGGRGVQLKPRRPVSLARASSVTTRLIVPPNSRGTRFDVVLTDSSGRRATLGRVSVNGLPGTDQTVGYWGQEVRVPLTAAHRRHLNLRRITRLQFVPRSRSGQAWLLDVWGRRAGTPSVKVRTTVRLDVGNLGTVVEGDTLVHYRMPVRVSGHGTGTFRVYIQNWTTNTQTVRRVSVKRGTRHIDVPVLNRGDRAFAYDSYINVLAEAIHGTSVGDYAGDLVVEEDDPLPTVSVTPLTDRVTEGGTLRWRVSLTPAPAMDIGVYMTIQPPAGGTELSTTDLSADWVTNGMHTDPQPSRPLSQSGGYVNPNVPAGQGSVELAIPTVTDDLVEGEEALQLLVEPLAWPPPPEPLVLTGTVIDAS